MTMKKLAVKKTNYFIPIAILILIVINLGLIFYDMPMELDKVRNFEFSVLMEQMDSDDMHSMTDEEMKHMIHSFVESGQKNPQLYVIKGETITVSFKNTNSMQHNFVIPDLSVETKILQPGEVASIQFKAPYSGNYEYFCSLHPDQMKGLITIS